MFWGVLLLFCLGLLGFGLGPRVKLRNEFKAIQLPEDLDDYLRQSEKNIKLTTPDVAKKIVWANKNTKEKTKISMVYLHGYMATSMETHPVTKRIAEHFGANVFYTRIDRHGETKERFAGTKADLWLEDTLEAWEIGKRIGEKVIIIGVSTGATLATWLSNTQSVPELAGLVFISPNFHPADSSSKILLLPWGTQIAKLIVGDEYHPWEPYDETQAKYWVTEPSLKATAQMMALVNLVDKLDLSKQSMPTLVFYSEDDDVVSIPKIKEKFKTIGAEQKKLIQVDTKNNPSSHVLAGDIVGMYATDFVVESTIQFLVSVL